MPRSQGHGTKKKAQVRNCKRQHGHELFIWHETMTMGSSTYFSIDMSYAETITYHPSQGNVFKLGSAENQRNS